MMRPDGPRRTHLLRLAGAALLVGFTLLLAGCDIGSRQNAFSPAGDVAQKQKDIFNLALWPAIVILIVVQGLLIYALIRYRQRRGQALPTQVHGNTRLEIAWTIAPAVLLLILAGPMVAGVVALAREPEANAFGEPIQVNVIARQWIFEFQYPEFTDTGGKPLSTFTELHIPVGREIGVQLTSTDVIHSFWVPKLAGKLDVIPGRTNKMWFDATEPGQFFGQCAEFCGLGHAGMRFCIIAESEDEFASWVEKKLRGEQVETVCPGGLPTPAQEGG